MLGRIIWYLKQLLPLTYRSHVLDTNGVAHFYVWKMWFGRCYAVEHLIVLNRPATIPMVRK